MQSFVKLGQRALQVRLLLHQCQVQGVTSRPQVVMRVTGLQYLAGFIDSARLDDAGRAIDPVGNVEHAWVIVMGNGKQVYAVERATAQDFLEQAPGQCNIAAGQGLKFVNDVGHAVNHTNALRLAISISSTSEFA